MRISDWSSDVCSADLEVSSATGRKGNVLYEIVRTLDGALDEARFVDQVSRNLAAGRFLLTVVGDGITEGTQRIGAFLTTQPDRKRVVEGNSVSVSVNVGGRCIIK